MEFKKAENYVWIMKYDEEKMCFYPDKLYGYEKKEDCQEFIDYFDKQTNDLLVGSNLKRK